MSSKRRKSRNNKYNSGMPNFQYSQKHFKQIPSLDRNASNFTTPWVTNNKFAKWVARHFAAFFIIMLIIMLVISVANLF